jgi:protein subunit release factor A
MDQVVKRFEMLEAQMAAGPEPDAYVRMASEYSEIQDLVGKIRALRGAEREQADLSAMLADKATDTDMRELAEAELPGLEERVEALERDIQILLLPRDAADEKNAILEIRAGTGGDEAALFAGDLFRMYERYAAAHGWRFETISASEGDVGGYKEIIASVSGKGVFAHLKFESGVHRVQRVPETEAQGRIHTSAARRARVASMSTPPIRPCASRTCRPASWWSPRRSPSTRTGRGRCRFCVHACSTWNAAGPRKSAPNRASRRSAPATGPSASAPTISLRGG